MADYGKQRIALRYWLLGAGYYRAADAMTFAERYHTGTRKDGKSHEFSHQVSIVSHLRTMHNHLINPEDAFCVGFLHDVREDYDVSDEEIRSRWGDRVADGVDAMTKTFRGVKRDEDELFQRIGEHSEACVAKLADRVHNHSTLLVFSDEKMASYIDETRRLFLPLARRARRNWPYEEPAIEGLRLILDSQLTLLDAVLAGRAALAQSEG